MPRPRSLTPTQITMATLVVIDRDGLPALTMRAVARELGMATMSLYRYVRDKDELEALVVDQVLATVDLAVPPGDWRERLTTLLNRVRDAVLTHPATVPLLLRHRHSAPASRRMIEATLTVLTDAGFTGTERVVAQRTLVAYLLGALQNTHFGPLSGAGTSAMAALSAEEFPLLAATAADAGEVSADEEFSGGLAAVLRGISGTGTREVLDVNGI